ncbi:hypothetical protein ACJ2CR_19350 [Myxococcus faecalis]|uniref:hypothetical protein n=1 Tax=Myxococcus faecalis TaxID=3115646 RepID=UPI0038CF33BA
MTTDAQYIRLWTQLSNTHHLKTFNGKNIAIKRGPVQQDRVGEFKPMSPALGIVAVYPRPGRGPFKEFCTLAHELGHAYSWINGTRSEAYEAVYNQPNPAVLPGAQKQLIIDEEIRAWHLGFGVAQEVGFDDRDNYVAEANLALRRYYDDLAMTPVPFSIAS